MRDSQVFKSDSLSDAEMEYESPTLVELGDLSDLTNYSVSVRAQ
jgi:hypothetical protein